MADELTIPNMRRDTSQPPRVSLSASSDDGRPERTRHSNHTYASSDVTATPSQTEDTETCFAKRSVKDISDTSSQSPWSKKYLLALGMCRSFYVSQLAVDIQQMVAESEDTRPSLSLGSYFVSSPHWRRESP
jgi:hypothetical protein